MTVIQWVKDLIGEKAFQGLIQSTGGGRLYIPKHKNSKIRSAVGDEKAKALIHIFGGDFLYLPIKQSSRGAGKWKPEYLQVIHALSTYKAAQVLKVNRQTIMRWKKRFLSH